jgi:Flp pilus assembly protein TadD
MTAWWAVVAALLAATGGAGALPPRGSDAPPIRLRDADGAEVTTAGMSPRSLVVIFGELDHAGTQRTCESVLDVLADPRIERGTVVPVLVVASGAEAGKAKGEGDKSRLPPIVLYDGAREAFGAYHILVIPSVVVVDGQGKVTYAMPGFVSRFKELLTTSVLTATGRQPTPSLDAVLSAGEAPAGSPDAVRAGRLVRLGEELVKHRLYEMAEARFTEALALEPGNVEAKLGLGDLMLRTNRVEDAAGMFRSVLAGAPDSPGALLGMAGVHLAKGGPEDEAAAEGLIKRVMDTGLPNATAHYLLGTIRESQGRAEEAAKQYRTAVELLLKK